MKVKFIKTKIQTKLELSNSSLFNYMILTELKENT